MTVRRQRGQLTQAVREALGAAAAAPGVRGSLELQAMQQAQLRGALFEYSRSSALGTVFPTSSARGQLVPRTLDPTVQLTHPVLGKAATSRLFDSFQITGANGVATVFGSTVPDGSITYYQPAALGAEHNGAAPRDMILGYHNEAKALFHVLRRSSFDHPAGLLNANEQYCNLHPFFVPAGFRPFAVVIGLLAGERILLTGMTIVLSEADEVPPVF